MERDEQNNEVFHNLLFTGGKSNIQEKELGSAVYVRMYIWRVLPLVYALYRYSYRKQKDQRLKNYVKELKTVIINEKIETEN